MWQQRLGLYSCFSVAPRVLNLRIIKFFCCKMIHLSHARPQNPTQKSQGLNRRLLYLQWLHTYQNLLRRGFLKRFRQ